MEKKLKNWKNCMATKLAWLESHWKPLENAQRCCAKETQAQELDKDVGGYGGKVEGYPTK